MTNFKIYLVESRPILVLRRVCSRSGVRRALRAWSAADVRVSLQPSHATLRPLLPMAPAGPWGGLWHEAGARVVQGLGSTRYSTLPVPTRYTQPRVPTHRTPLPRHTGHPSHPRYCTFQVDQGDPRGVIAHGHAEAAAATGTRLTPLLSGPSPGACSCISQVNLRYISGISQVKPQVNLRYISG